MKLKGVPRFHGRAEELENGEWQWVVYVSLIGEGEPFATLESDRCDFKSKGSAIKDMNVKIRKLAAEIGKQQGGDGSLIDFKSNRISKLQSV